MDNRKTASKAMRKAAGMAALAAAMALSACGSNGGNEGGSANGAAPSPSGSATAAPEASAPPAELAKVTQVTNWFAQPEHGGQYAALAKDFYKEAGLDMTIQSGGPGISSTQIVASGKAEFGMGQADEILLARQNGIPLVAIAATFQKNPQGIMYHKGKYKDVSELNGHKVYVGSGVAFWEYLKRAYKLDGVEEMKYTGSLANFVDDPDSATQMYVTSEPYTMEQQGVAVDSFLNYDLGYKQYGNVLYTTEDYLKKHPDRVKAYVEASVKGWNYYRDNAEEINLVMQKSNPDLKLEAMAFGTKALEPLVYGGDAETNGVGYMSKDIWEGLQRQLVEIGLLTEAEPIDGVFTNEFLPSP
ncbi:ABC transporter substrate-binding protein [Paenibacillus pasadenensis]|uniref:Hydroxymethylpyrimidine ABC transporter, substrate-binding component n=1 Tax=Paenibacillus pasadenensis TaxID=217090 RepID=A0A2N5N1J0_9BACL|nr:ABC transporter substrate-binding protein [Paenibacillus pasadenensis]PLT44207.1 Hydroxymethylpyrimidine ABC transporter, substrate-binding component [Paenibacillus pasadenensis]